MGGPTGAGGKPRFLGDVGAAHQRQGPRRHRVGAGRHRHPGPVGGEVGVAGGVVERPVAVPGRFLAELVVVQDVRAEGRHHGLEDAEIDDLALAGGVSVSQGHQHGGRGGEAGDAVGQPERRERGGTVRLARHVREPAHGLDQRAEGRARRVGAVLAEPGHPAEDESRVYLGQPIPAESPAFEGAGPEVLDDHVRGRHELLEDRRRLRIAEVEADAALVAADHLPPETLPLALAAVPPQAVAASRMLDLDDLGAVVAEHLAGERAGEHRGAVQNAQIGERTRPRSGCAPALIHDRIVNAVSVSGTDPPSLRVSRGRIGIFRPARGTD